MINARYAVIDELALGVLALSPPPHATVTASKAMTKTWR